MKIPVSWIKEYIDYNISNEKIAELLAALKLKEALELLILYDHDHKKVYESYLKN